MPQAMSTLQAMSLAAGLEGDSSGFEKRLPEMIQEVCADCAVSKIARMETEVSGAVQAPRSMAWLLGGFALLAVGLAVAGVHAVGLPRGPWRSPGNGGPVPRAG